MRTEKEAVAMIDPRNLDTLLHPQFDALHLRLQLQQEEVLEHLLAHVVRLFSQQKTQKSGMQEARKLFL